jgi:hypothetical protein
MNFKRPILNFLRHGKFRAYVVHFTLMSKATKPGMKVQKIARTDLPNLPYCNPMALFLAAFLGYM